MAPAPWRSQLYPATFRGAEFHVEVREKESGRRDVLHEFPHRDQPYSEDLGRRARRFSVNGYVIGPNYITLRDALIAALEVEGPASLVLPTQGQQQVQVDHYTVTERRERGGVAEFQMTFTEAGGPVSYSTNTATVAAVSDAATAASQAVQQALNLGLKGDA
jgi:prophage DNA circulation protein